MHLHRGFGDAGDAAIVGNLFAQAAARHLNGNWWKWTTLCGPLRVPRKCMNPFWMPAMNYTSEVESNASTASLLRQSRQPCWAASRADRRAIMDAVMRQIGQEGYKRTPPISLFSPSLWFHEPRRHSAFRAIHRVRLYAHHLRAYSRKSSLV
jgi:hypothetical protein